MSVFLQDGMVLLDGGSVATDVACCCGPSACCLPDGSCVLTNTQTECTILGGNFFGGLSCDPPENPCPGACCVGGVCSIQIVSTCDAMGGVFFPGITCTPDPCVCPATDTVTVTFSDLAACGCGSAGGVLGANTAELMPSEVTALNIAYTLPVVSYIPPTAIYRYTSPTPITLFLYSDAFCNVPFSTPSIPVYFSVELQCSSPGGNSVVNASLITNPFGIGQVYQIFIGDIHFGPSLPPITYMSTFPTCVPGSIAAGSTALGDW